MPPLFSTIIFKNKAKYEEVIMNQYKGTHYRTPPHS